MMIHVYFNKYNNLQDFELFKKEHPECFKNIAFHNMTKEQKITEAQTKLMLDKIEKEPDYFAIRAKELNKNL